MWPDELQFGLTFLCQMSVLSAMQREVNEQYHAQKENPSSLLVLSGTVNVCIVMPFSDPAGKKAFADFVKALHSGGGI